MFTTAASRAGRKRVLGDSTPTADRLATLSASLDASAGIGLLTNPFFEVSQENGTTLKSAIGNAITYAADQWFAYEDLATLVASTQNVVTPFSGTADFKRLQNSKKTIATTLQASLAAGESLLPCTQRIEGNFIKTLGWGTADARAIDVVFIVQASQTGTYTAALRNAAVARSYVAAFSLVASTPTVVFFTVPGDTTGTWVTDTGMGMSLDICCVTGSTFQTANLNAWQAGNFLSTSAALVWGNTTNAFVQVAYANIFPSGVLPFTSASQITGEALHRLLNMRRPYDQETQRCQRYWWLGGSMAGGWGGSSTTATVVPQLQVVMRSTITLGLVNGSVNGGSALEISVAQRVISALVTSNITPSGARFDITTAAAGLNKPCIIEAGTFSFNARM